MSCDAYVVVSSASVHCDGLRYPDASRGSGRITHALGIHVWRSLMRCSGTPAKICNCCSKAVRLAINLTYQGMLISCCELPTLRERIWSMTSSMTIDTVQLKSKEQIFA